MQAFSYIYGKNHSYSPQTQTTPTDTYRERKRGSTSGEAEQDERETMNSMNSSRGEEEDNLLTHVSLRKVMARPLALCFDRMDIYLVLSCLVHVPVILLSVALSLAIAPLGDREYNSHVQFIYDHMGTLLFLSYAQSLISLLIIIIGQGGMVRATAEMYAQEGHSNHPHHPHHHGSLAVLDWYSAWRAGMRKFGTLLLASLVTYVVYFLLGGLIVLFVCIVIFSNMIFFQCLATVTLAISFAVLVYAWLTFVPLYSIIVVEGKGPWRAIQRSIELSAGQRRYFFPSMATFFVLYWVSKIAFIIMFHGSDPSRFFFAPMGAFTTYLPSFLYIPLNNILGSVLYFSVRVDKEGLNREVLQRELAAMPLTDSVHHSNSNNNSILSSISISSTAVNDYRRVALVDDQQRPNIDVSSPLVPNLSSSGDDYEHGM